jgi:hypothetical protein
MRIVRYSIITPAEENVKDTIYGGLFLHFGDYWQASQYSGFSREQASTSSGVRVTPLVKSIVGSLFMGVQYRNEKAPKPKLRDSLCEI